MLTASNRKISITLRGARRSRQQFTTAREPVKSMTAVCQAWRSLGGNHNSKRATSPKAKLRRPIGKAAFSRKRNLRGAALPVQSLKPSRGGPRDTRADMDTCAPREILTRPTASQTTQFKISVKRISDFARAFVIPSQRGRSPDAVEGWDSKTLAAKSTCRNTERAIAYYVRHLSNSTKTKTRAQSLHNSTPLEILGGRGLTSYSELKRYQDTRNTFMEMIYDGSTFKSVHDLFFAAPTAYIPGTLEYVEISSKAC